MRLFRRFPWLFFLLAASIIANIVLQFSPGQVMASPMSFIVPGVMILLGIGGYVVRRMNPVQDE